MKYTFFRKNNLLFIKLAVPFEVGVNSHCVLNLLQLQCLEHLSGRFGLNWANISLGSPVKQRNEKLKWLSILSMSLVYRVEIFCS